MAREHYTEEQMINYVVILHYVYNGRCAVMAKAMGMGKNTLASWRNLYLDKAINLIDKPSVSDILNEEPPTIKALYDKFLLLLEKTNNPQDASYYAQVIHKLSDLMKKGGDSEKEKEDIWEKLNKKLRGDETGKTNV